MFSWMYPTPICKTKLTYSILSAEIQHWNRLPFNLCSLFNHFISSILQANLCFTHSKASIFLPRCNRSETSVPCLFPRMLICWVFYLKYLQHLQILLYKTVSSTALHFYPLQIIVQIFLCFTSLSNYHYFLLSSSYLPPLHFFTQQFPTSVTYC